MQHVPKKQKVAWFFLLFLLAGSTAAAVEVELKSTAACKHQFVSLGDIAIIRNCDAATKDELSAVPLLPSPAEGRIRVLRVREVQEILELRGKDMDLITWRGASRVELRGQVEPSTAAPASKSIAPPDGKLVVVATRTLQSGETLHAEDIELKRVSYLRGQKAPIEKIEDAIGMQVARSVSAGQVVDAVNLRRPKLVQRFRDVVVFSRIGGIQVSTKGRALEEGAKDDVIDVELPGKKRVAGRVVGLDEIEVFAQGVALEPTKMREAPVTRPKKDREIARRAKVHSQQDN